MTITNWPPMRDWEPRNGGEDGRMAGGDGSLSKDDRLIIFNITHYKLQILLPLPVRPPIRVE